MKRRSWLLVVALAVLPPAASGEEPPLYAPVSVPGFPQHLQTAIHTRREELEPGWDWYVVVGADTTCEGQAACMAASVQGSRNLAAFAKMPGRTVNLGRDGTGRYVEMTCGGAGCTPATLTFRRGNQLLQVGMRTSTLAQLVSVARHLRRIDRPRPE